MLASAGAGLRSSWESGHLTDTNRMDWECPELSESVGKHARRQEACRKCNILLGLNIYGVAVKANGQLLIPLH